MPLFLVAMPLFMYSTKCVGFFEANCGSSFALSFGIFRNQNLLFLRSCSCEWFGKRRAEILELLKSIDLGPKV